MNKKGRLFTLILFMLIVLSACVAFVSTVEEVTGQEQELVPLHVNLKSGDELNSETKLPSDQQEQMYVQADIDDGYAARRKYWTDAGTWTSSSRESAFNVGGRVTFNIWYNIIQGSPEYDALPEFRFTLSADGTQLIQIAGPEGQDPGDDSILEYTVSGNFDSVELEPGAELSLYIEYRAYEDCNIHYDNATYDSGFFAESDFCMVFSYGGNGDKVSTEVYDAWGADWDRVGNYIEIFIDGAEANVSGFITKDGNKYTVDENEYQSTLIQWTLEEKLQKGQNVTLWIKYTPAPGETSDDRGFEKGFEVGSGGGGGGGGGGSSGGDGDSDDDKWYEDTMVLGGIGGVAAIAAIGLVFMFVIKPRREAGDEDEDEDYDEDEDEDEDYDEDEEMDYEE